MSCFKCGREEGRSCSVCFKCFCECDILSPEHDVINADGEPNDSSIAELIKQLVDAKSDLRIAEVVRDDARAASARDLEARRRAWYDGVQACIDLVKRRHEHYEMYRCDCLDRDPGNGHVPGCKGEMMSTHPATFAILDEIFVLLSAMKLRGAP